MEQQKALELLEQARRTQSCDLADGLIDDLIPYWTVVEKAFKNIIGDDSCKDALDLLVNDGEAERAAYDSEHGAFLIALMIRYKREAAARQSNGAEDGQPTLKASYAEDTLTKDYPEVANFIEHGLYEAFSVPDAYGTFDLPVYPNSCRVTAEYLNPAGNVSGYVLDNGKMLLVMREGNGEEDKVTDVRYAEATTNNIRLVMRQCEGRPFEWDAIESPDHDRLLRDGAIPTMASGQVVRMTADSSHEGTGSQIATHRDIIADIHSGCLMMDVLVDPSEGRSTDNAVDMARYAAFLRTSTGQAILNQL